MSWGEIYLLAVAVVANCLWWSSRARAGRLEVDVTELKRRCDNLLEGWKDEQARRVRAEANLVGVGNERDRLSKSLAAMVDRTETKDLDYDKTGESQW